MNRINVKDIWEISVWDCSHKSKYTVQIGLLARQEQCHKSNTVDMVHHKTEVCSCFQVADKYIVVMLLKQGTEG